MLTSRKSREAPRPLKERVEEERRSRPSCGSILSQLALLVLAFFAVLSALGWLSDDSGFQIETPRVQIVTETRRKGDAISPEFARAPPVWIEKERPNPAPKLIVFRPPAWVGCLNEIQPDPNRKHIVPPPTGPVTLVCCNTTKGPLNIEVHSYNHTLIHSYTHTLIHSYTHTRIH